jgi:hypothetical protein
MNIRNRIFRIEQEAGSELVSLLLLVRRHEWIQDGRRGRDGLPIDYRVVETTVPIMRGVTREAAEHEARSAWRNFPVSTKPFSCRRIPTSARRVA